MWSVGTAIFSVVSIKPCLGMLSVRVQIIVILLLGDALRGRISVIHAIQHAYC